MLTTVLSLCVLALLLTLAVAICGATLLFILVLPSLAARIGTSLYWMSDAGQPVLGGSNDWA